MHPLPARPCGRAGRGQGLLVAVFSLLSAALLVGSFFKASDSLRPTEVRRAIDTGQEWEEAIRMFASVAPAVPRGFPTATEPLPEELAVAKCHSFNAAYSAMHRRTLAAPRNSPNYRLAVAAKASHGGLADFITGSVGTFLWSAVEDRAYQLHWPLSKGVFHSPHLKITYTEDPSYLKAPNSHPAKRAASPDGRAQLMVTQALNRTAWRDLHRALVNDSFSEHFNHSVEILAHNCGLARWLYDDEVPQDIRAPRWMAEKLVALGLPDWRTAYACALNTLYQLDAEHLQRVAPLANLLTSHKSLSICIHVRAGDEYLRNASAAQADLAEVLLWTESYFDCAQEIERQHLQRGQAPVWYLASDNDALRDAMRHHFPDKLIYFPARPHRDYSPAHEASRSTDAKCLSDAQCSRQVQLRSLIDTMQEWYLLGLCDYIVMPGDSGFSSTAYGRTFKSDTAYLMRWQKRSVNGSICTAPSPAKYLSRSNAGW